MGARGKSRSRQHCLAVSQMAVERANGADTPSHAIQHFSNILPYLSPLPSDGCRCLLRGQALQMPQLAVYTCTTSPVVVHGPAPLSPPARSCLSRGQALWMRHLAVDTCAGKFTALL